MSSGWVTNREGNIIYEDESKRSARGIPALNGYTNIVVNDSSMCVRLMLWSYIHSQQTFPLKWEKLKFKMWSNDPT